jgi:L-seryl-tRNA(Ser) seleniumtransferase
MEALRQIPPVNDVLRSEELEGFRRVLETPFGMRFVEDVMTETRQSMVSAPVVVPRTELTGRIAREVARRLAGALEPSLRRVINASGVVLHTNLGRAPLPDSAIDHVREVSTGYSNLEFMLEEGERGKRDQHIDRLVRQLIRCEAAIVVNNNAAAVLLVLNTFGEGGEIIASRGEQVEIGGAFRIPEVMAKSGAQLREVGTTNRTRIKDYEKAINEKTRLLLRVHPSNFRITGFTEKPTLKEFVELGQRKNIPTFEDLGSGCMFDVKPLGIEGEPTALESIEMGVDVISFSGDKLLGGPQAGIIAGKKIFVERVRQNPLFRALRVDKLTIAALESILISYLNGNIDEIPIWRMLRTPESVLKRRAETFARRIGSAGQTVQLSSIVGGGSAPEAYLPSWGVSLKVTGVSDAELEKRLRFSKPPVIVRIEEGQVMLDFRTISEEDEEDLFATVSEAVKAR